MANEPDIAYPYLFNYVKGEEFRSQELVKLVKKYFKNKPDGLQEMMIQVLCRLGWFIL
jgi:putative alpha-1,2-mannosidase